MCRATELGQLAWYARAAKMCRKDTEMSTLLSTLRSHISLATEYASGCGHRRCGAPWGAAEAIPPVWPHPSSASPPLRPETIELRISGL